jgi:HSP20 family molecular chaperone IbpA
MEPKLGGRLMRTMNEMEQGGLPFPVLTEVASIRDFKDLERVFDQIFSDISIKDVRRMIEDYPVPIDIYTHRETKGGKVVVALPGFTREEIKVVAEDGCLLIEAKHKEETDANAEWEKISGKIKSKEFSQRLRLMNRWNLADAKIQFENGELIITMPVKEEMKRKELQFSELNPILVFIKEKPLV